MHRHEMGWGGSFRRAKGRTHPLEVIPSCFHPSQPSVRLSCGVSWLGQNQGVRQVHHPRRTSNFYLLAMVGWCTRRQATVWLKAWWCVLTRTNVLQRVLYLVSKH